jgi:hypothetical protein
MTTPVDRGLDFLQTLVNEGDVKIFMQDLILKNFDCIVCRVVKFDNKVNTVKYPEKTDKDGNVTQPANEAQALRVFFYIYTHSSLDSSGSKPEMVEKKVNSYKSINFKLSALTNLATLQKKMEDSTGDRSEICNWKIEISRKDEKSESTGYNYTTFRVVEIEKVGKDDSEVSKIAHEDSKVEAPAKPANTTTHHASAPTAPANTAPANTAPANTAPANTAPASNTAGVVSDMAGMKKILEDSDLKSIVGKFREMSPGLGKEVVKELASHVVVVSEQKARDEISNSLDHRATCDELIAGPLANMKTIHDKLKAYADTLADDIPF